MRIIHPYLLLCFFVLLPASCDRSPGDITVPEHLLGTWRTSDTRFSGCEIEITEDMLILGLKNGATEYYSILKTTSSPESADAASYTIHYIDSAVEGATMTFIYDAHSGAVRLKHRSEIWKQSNE